MGLSIKNEEVEKLAREVADARKVSLTRAIRDALAESKAALSAKRRRSTTIKAIRALQGQARRLTRAEKRSFKALRDELWG